MSSSEIESIPHNQIQPSPLNPRKSFSPEGIQELAASIQAEGLLQNLVVRPTGSRFGRHEIAAGERRWRALQHLIASGALPEDHPVPCRVVELTDLQLLQLATTENMARADMSPLEEARAFQQMLQLGSDVDTISAETGLSVPTVRKRLALVERLSGVAQEALEAGQINLGQAQALTTTSPVFQDSMLNDLGEGERLFGNADSIRRQFQQEAPAVSIAKFDLKDYTGTYTRPNIFSEAEEDRFDDLPQFRKLQGEAVQRLAAEAERSWGWAKVQKYGLDYDQEQAPEDEHIDFKQHGVVIHYTPEWGDGSVTIYERVRQKAMYANSPSSGADKPAQDPLALTQKHVERIDLERTKALQAAVLDYDDAELREQPLGAVHLTLVLGMLPGVGLAGRLQSPEIHWNKFADADPTLHKAVDRLQNDAPVTADAIRTGGNRSWGDPVDVDAVFEELVDAPAGTVELALTILTAWSVNARFHGASRSLYEFVIASDYLPSFADLGPEYLGLYKPARLKQVSAAVLGYSGEDQTKKQLINLIDAAQSQDVPPELQLTAQDPGA